MGTPSTSITLTIQIHLYKLYIWFWYARSTGLLAHGMYNNALCCGRLKRGTSISLSWVISAVVYACSLALAFASWHVTSLCTPRPRVRALSISSWDRGAGVQACLKQELLDTMVLLDPGNLATIVYYPSSSLIACIWAYACVTACMQVHILTRVC